MPLLRACFVLARASPPAAPASAAPPATSGIFALLAALPTVFPALLALSPASSAVCWATFTAFGFDALAFARFGVDLLALVLAGAFALACALTLPLDLALGLDLALVFVFV